MTSHKIRIPALAMYVRQGRELPAIKRWCALAAAMIFLAVPAYTQYQASYDYGGSGDESGVVQYATSLHYGSQTDEEEWLFTVLQDGDNFIAGGFAETAGVRHPAMVTVDHRLEKLNDLRIDVLTESSDSYNVSGGFGNIKEVRVISDGYIGAGYSGLLDNGNFKIKAIVVKTDKDLNIVTARAYHVPDAKDYRFFGIREYTDASGNLKYYAVGSTKYGTPAKSYWYIARLNSNLDMEYEYEIQDDACNLIEGGAHGLCFGYSEGSVPDGTPVCTATNTLESVMVVGNKITDGNPRVGMAVKFDFSNIDGNQNSTVCADSDLEIGTSYYPAGFFDPINNSEFSVANWVCRTETELSASPHCQIHGIEQDMEGDFVIGVSAHHKHLGPFSDAPICQAVVNTGHKEYQSGSLVLHLLDDDLLEISKRHVGHISGFDLDFKPHFDWDGNVLVMSTTGDTGKTLIRPNGIDRYHVNYLLFKAKIDKTAALPADKITPSWYKIYVGGAYLVPGKSGNGCGFNLCVTSDNDIVGVGNDGHEHENWDFSKVSNDCAMNNLGAYPPSWGSTVFPNSAGKIYSVQTALTSGTHLTWGQNHVVEARVVVEPGYTLEIPITGNNTTRFVDLMQIEERGGDQGLDGASIYVMPGGRLILRNQALLRNAESSECYTRWRGVQLGDGTIWPAYAQLLMENSTIENADVGVDVQSGIIDCSNNDILNPSSVGHHFDNTVNFINNREAIKYHAGSTDGAQNVFRFVNFYADASVRYNGQSMDRFVSMEHINGIVMRGCNFENSYYDKRGLLSGINTFSSSLDLMIGDYGAQPQCGPVGRPCRFVGLKHGVRHSSDTFDPVDLLRVAECEFFNVRNPILTGGSINSFIYRNKIDWLNMPPELSGYKFGIFASWAWGADLIENTIINDDQDAFLGLYSEQTSWDPSFTVFTSGNWVEEKTAGNASKAYRTFGDNSYMQIACNNYTQMQQDWDINGNLPDQGSIFGDNNNIWSVCAGGGTNNINSSTTFRYYVSGGPSWPNCVSPNVIIQPGASPTICVDWDRCSIYGVGQGETWVLIVNAFQKSAVSENDVRLSARNHQAMQQLPELIGNRPSMEWGDINAYVDGIGASQRQKREFNMTAGEKQELFELAASGPNLAARLARERLFFYADTDVEETPFNDDALPGDGVLDGSAAAPEGIALVHPNPSNGLVGVTYPGKGDEGESFDLLVTDLNGRVVLRKNDLSTKVTHELNLTAEAAGVYFVKMTQGKHSSFARIFKR